MIRQKKTKLISGKKKKTENLDKSESLHNFHFRALEMKTNQD